jgi:DNA-nicking Smr family endonuclease
MENSKSKIIKEIAQELDCGFDCYYNSKTDEIVTIPNFGEMMDEDEFRDAFRAELKKVKENKTDFIKIEVLESFESFKIMERFVSQIADEQFQAELENILERKKPFQNFKNRIDNSDFRQKWFDFKINELEKNVVNQLERGKHYTQQRI